MVLTIVTTTSFNIITVQNLLQSLVRQLARVHNTLQPADTSNLTTLNISPVLALSL